jgi:hypothetical protein
MGGPGGDGELIADFKVALAAIDGHPERSCHDAELLDLADMAMLGRDGRASAEIQLERKRLAAAV